MKNANMFKVKKGDWVKTQQYRQVIGRKAKLSVKKLFFPMLALGSATGFYMFNFLCTYE